jgi:Tfp pilus assembly protein FimT
MHNSHDSPIHVATSNEVQGRPPRGARRQRLRPGARGFTLVELGLGLAVAGIVSALGVAGMTELIRTERARNEAVRFSMELRRSRTEAIQQGMHTLVTFNTTATGTRVEFRAKREGVPGTSPCELMARGDADSSTSTLYAEVNIDKTSTTPGTRDSELCFTPTGKPFTNDLSAVAPSEMIVSSSARTELTLTVDAFGSISSSDQPVATGIAQTSLHLVDVLANESAPAPPNLEDTPTMPFYEVSPGIYVEAGAGGGSDDFLGGTDDPCRYDSSYCYVEPDPYYCDPYLGCVIP